MTDLAKRALTPEQKRALLDQLLAAWLEAPNLRLGQLIVNAVGGRHLADIFYREDDDLLANVETFVTKNKT